MSLSKPLLVLVLTVSLSSYAVQTFAQFEGLLSRVPLDANTLIVIDAEKLFGSKLADRERWEARRKSAFDAGVSALPPDATSIVMAARTDFETSVNDWELSLARFEQGREVTATAQRFGGSIDTIADRTVARLPNDYYIVQISPNVLGMYSPASRQSVSRWLTSTDKTNLDQSMSPYLLTAYGYASKVGTPIVMAIDVAGVFSPAEAASRLAEFKSLNQHADIAAALAKLAGSVRGATLGITVGDTAGGAVRVDFTEPLQLSAAVLKPILLEILARHGAMVDDFESWEPSVQGNTFMLKGTLSTAGTRRVLSVLELPPALAHSLDQVSSNSPTGSGGPSPSQLYFQSVKSLLDDLRLKPKTDHVQTAGQAAIWYDKYARKIDQLPLLNVDQTLLSYGADIAGGLRDANSALRGIGMRSAVRTVNNADSGGSTAGLAYAYGGYNYGYYDMRSGDRVAADANTAIRTQERVSGVATVQSIWKNIDEATAMIRREMTQKYEVEF